MPSGMWFHRSTILSLMSTCSEFCGLELGWLTLFIRWAFSTCPLKVNSLENPLRNTLRWLWREWGDPILQTILHLHFDFCFSFVYDLSGIMNCKSTLSCQVLLPPWRWRRVYWHLQLRTEAPQPFTLLLTPLPLGLILHPSLTLYCPGYLGQIIILIFITLKI